jgi:hypothetical protein
MCSHEKERNQRRRQRYAEDEEYREKTRAYQRAWHAANKERVNAESRQQWHEDPTRKLRQRAYRRESQRKDHLKYYYGITVEEYNAILKRQNGRCRICKCKPKGHLHVDHNHKTGKVRGLLCRSCNIGLGHLRDNPHLARIAAAYIEDDGDWITRSLWWEDVSGWLAELAVWLRAALGFRSPDEGAALPRRNPGSTPRGNTAPDCGARNARLHPGYKNLLSERADALAQRRD